MADFLYKGVVDWFLDQMSQDKLAAGDKMPSLRKLAKELKLSLNTIIHGYEILCEEGWIESRPKSGYFVCHRSQAKPASLMVGESLQTLSEDGLKMAWSCLAHRNALVDHDEDFFRVPNRAEEQDFPVLGKGHLSAREAVSRYLSGLGIKAHGSQLWLTRSGLSAFSQSVLALTQVQDSVLVLTPCDPRLTSTLHSLGRKVVTLAVGERGADLDIVINSLRDEQIAMLVLPGQFAFPAGQLISNLSLRRWLAIIEEVQIPVVEWDMCSHLGYRASSLMTYKSLDHNDHIIYIGGIESKSADGCQAWCLAGRYQSALEGAFIAADMALSNQQQEALTSLLDNSGKRSLSKHSRDMWGNAERIKGLLEQRLAEQVSFAASRGGLSLWMHLAQPLSEVDANTLLAMFRQVVVPGTLLSFEADAEHWLAINISADDKDISAFADKLAECLAITPPAQADAVEIDEVPENTATSPSQQATAEMVAEQMSPASKDSKAKAEHRDASTEPLYNPMLDLINHDFG